MKKMAMMIGVVITLARGGVFAEGDGKVAAAAGANGGFRGMEKQEYAEAAKARLDRLMKQFKTRERKKDPFGLDLEPRVVEEEPVMVTGEAGEEKKETVPVKVVLLQDAVDKFQVNGVNAGQQMVMVGARSLRRGDPVEIEHEGEVFKLRIVKIAVDEVVFMNTKNQETASVRLGVVKGIKGAGNSGKSPIKGKVVKPGSIFKVE